MQKNIFRHFVFVAVATMIFFSFTTRANATLDFSVVPVNGGTDVRFTRGDLSSNIGKEIRIRVTSSDNVQYQVYQQIISPFTNERGVTLNRPVLEANVSQGSNTAGTTYLPSFEPVNTAEQLLFTSSPSGQSDSFTTIYRVNTALLSDSGSFNGQILYTVRPIGGGQRQSVQTTVFIESNSELTVDLEASSGHNLVRIDTSRESSSPSFVNVSFSGNLGGSVKVYQEVVRYPVDDLNLELASGILSTVSSGGQQGQLSFQSPAEIPRNRELIYKSNQQSDSFSVKFFLTPEKLLLQKAGSYHGLVHYTVETETMQKDFDIDLDISIAPIFEIIMDFPQGPMNFANVLPAQKPALKEVNVIVKTNLGRPYSVIQHLPDLLTNEKGESVPGKYFMYKVQIASDSKAVNSAVDFVPVQKGDKEIFISDLKGSSEEFKVFYQLSPFEGMHAGDYRSAIKYSLGEL